MKLTVLLATVWVVFASAGKAAPLCVSGGTMASYEALGAGGCVIGNALFSNFGYVSTSGGNGTAVADTAVFLTPVAGAQGPGIVFSSSNWSVTADPVMPSLVDSAISFTVAILDGSPAILGGVLSLSPPPASAATGTGAGNIGETINPSGIQLQVDLNGALVSSQQFTPTNTVSVLKDLQVSALPGSGFAQIGSFEEDFSEAPEPVSAVLIGSGLLGLGLWRRRNLRHG